MFLLYASQHCMFYQSWELHDGYFILQLPSLRKATAGLQMMMSLFIWQKPILPTMPACTKGLGVTTDKAFQKALPTGILGISWKVRMSVMYFWAASYDVLTFPCHLWWWKGRVFAQGRGLMKGISQGIHVDLLSRTWVSAGSPSQQFHKWLRQPLLSGCFCALS